MFEFSVMLILIMMINLLKDDGPKIRLLKILRNCECMILVFKLSNQQPYVRLLVAMLSYTQQNSSVSHPCASHHPHLSLRDSSLRAALH